MRAIEDVTNPGGGRLCMDRKNDSNDLRRARKEIPFLLEVVCLDGCPLKENIK